jgi:hypothetical protein
MTLRFFEDGPTFLAPTLSVTFLGSTPTVVFVLGATFGIGAVGSEGLRFVLGATFGIGAVFFEASFDNLEAFGLTG